MGIFNREYQRRAARQALARVGVGLVQDNSGFYRPVKRVQPGVAVKDCKKRSGKLQGVQLELFAMNDPVPATQSLNHRVPSADRPLFDLFPEAYL